MYYQIVDRDMKFKLFSNIAIVCTCDSPSVPKFHPFRTVVLFRSRKLKLCVTIYDYYDYYVRDIHRCRLCTYVKGIGN